MIESKLCGQIGTSSGTPCRFPAGSGTHHLGIGPCWKHGGGKIGTHRRSLGEQAWELAVKLAGELNVTPWEALLLEVRRSAFRASAVDMKLDRVVAQRDSDEERTDPEVFAWLRESRNERRHLARVSKAAIDAGVAERLVRNLELEVQLVTEVLGAVLDALNLPHEQNMQALEIAHTRLLSIESGEARD